MRSLGAFIGSGRRNDPVELVDLRPKESFGSSSIHSGDAGQDGYTLLSRANPRAQGNPPPVEGVVGPVYRGPDESFEQ